MEKAKTNKIQSVGLQTTLPCEYESNTTFLETLKILRDLGCDHVELNIPYPEKVEPESIQNMLRNYNLYCTNLATGGLYPGQVLSLIHGNQRIREDTIEILKDLIQFCEAAQIDGIILGLIQGSSCKSREDARKHFRESLEKLLPIAKTCNVKIIVEATNRYLSNVANSLADTVELIEGFPNDIVSILPDTFHMNIEERDLCSALKTYSHFYNSIHFSDNNRFYPGLGAINFKKVYETLKSINFSGEITIEGNIKDSFFEDMKTAVQIIRKFEKRNV